MGSPNIHIPNFFVDFLKTRFGAEADAWLSSIPNMLAEKLVTWSLVLESNVALHGAMSLVFFVTQGDEKLALKISWRDDCTEQEPRALKLWGGNGAAQLIAYDSVHHILLMERLSSISLADITIPDAGVEAGKLIRTLSVPCQTDFPKLSDRAINIQTTITTRKTATNDQVNIGLVSDILARRMPLIDSYLCHGDLCYLNVLQAHNGEWKAIDPKPIIGDVEFSVPELMWTRVDEIADSAIVSHLDRIVRAGGLDRQKAIDWSIIRTVDYYFWAIDQGFTIDPKRCLRVYRALIGEAQH